MWYWSMYGGKRQHPKIRRDVNFSLTVVKLPDAASVPTGEEVRGTLLPVGERSLEASANRVPSAPERVNRSILEAVSTQAKKSVAPPT